MDVIMIEKEEGIIVTTQRSLIKGIRYKFKPRLAQKTLAQKKIGLKIKKEPENA